MSQQGQPPVVDPKAPITSPEAKAPETQPDPRIEQLARKERAIRAEAKRLTAMKAEIESAKQAPQKPVFDPKEFKQRFLQDPMSLGFTPDELQGVLLNQANQSPEAVRIRQLEAKLAELEGKQSQSLEKIEASQKDAYNTAVKQLTREVSLLVDGNDAYETIKATGRQSEVVRYIEDTYQEDGILLSAEEAAQQVEDYLLEEAINLAKLKKVQTRLAPPSDASPEQPTSKQQSPITTLTRQIESTSKTLTAKERRERAIAAFTGQLK